MKKTYLILLTTFIYNLTFGQNIAFMKMTQFVNGVKAISNEGTIDFIPCVNPYLNDAIVEALNKNGLNAKLISNKELFKGYNNLITILTKDQIANLRMFNHDYIILHKSEKKNQYYEEICCSFLNLEKNVNWQSEFYVFNVNTNQSKVISLAISTFDCGDKLETCSNIVSFTQEVNDFIQSFNSSNKSLAIQNYSNKADINITKNIFISKPSLMVIPNKINPAKLINGEYQLTKNEKMLIAAFKNKFEDNHYTTFGFESVLKRIYENRLINDNIHDDIKSKILESSGIDFFVEFENLDENNTNCDKVYDFKIRNFSTGEDVASDLKNLNQCGNSETYKDFASSILNAGAVSKINSQKVNITFTISNTSDARLNKEYNGIKLGVHINNCLQSLSFKGNLELQEESDLRKQATINIPVFEENSGQRYQTTTFAEEVISYLKKNAGVECDRVVSRQSINIKIK